MSDDPRPPVHDSLSVVTHEDIFQNEKWWKSVVRYKYDEDDDHVEVAVYLWKRDDGWTRKNKYVIKTAEAWRTDKTIIDRLFDDPASIDHDETYPASDYYTVGAGETIFRSDGWWKAILRINQKDSYDVEEVMVYLWQEVDGDWRRRQKYTIKGRSDWEEEVEVIENLLDVDSKSVTTNRPTEEDSSDATSGPVPAEFEQLSRELDKHLSVSEK